MEKVLLSILVFLVLVHVACTSIPTSSPTSLYTQTDTSSAEGVQHRGEEPKAAPVLFVPIAERHVSAVEVTMSSSTENAKLWYTIDGSDPVPHGSSTNMYSISEPLYIDDIGVTIINAVATAENFDTSVVSTKKYTVIDRCAEPSFDPQSNETFAGHAEVTISTTTVGAKIHYTLDGSHPSVSGDQSTTVLESGSSIVLKSFGKNVVRAVAVKDGFAPSQAREAIFYILPKVEDPVISPEQDTFPISAGLRITCATTGAKIYYTTDGTLPNVFSFEYFEEEGLTLAGAGRHQVRAYAHKQNYEDSEVVTKDFLIVDRLVRPVPTPSGGSYVGDVEVTIECPEAPEDTVVYYTTKARETPVEHRSNPTVKCGSAITLSAPGEYVLRAFTKASAMAISPMAQQHYSVVRPQYDTLPLDMEERNVYRVEPLVDVVSVQIPIPAAKYDACSSSARVVGTLARLSNVLGHFDVALPPEGCVAPLARLRSLKDISSHYEFGRSTFNGATAASKEDQTKLDERNRARFRALLPRDGVSLEQWRKWLMQYEEEDSGCVVAASGGSFNLTTFACTGSVVSSGRVVQTSSRKNVNLGVRGNTVVVGYVPESEVQSTLNPFDALITGTGWLVRNGASYVRESLTADGEDTAFLPRDYMTQRAARSAVGFNKAGELLLLQTGATAVGLTLEEFAAAAVNLGFVQAINLVGGDLAGMTANHTLISPPSASCSSMEEGAGAKGGKDGDEYMRCERPISTAACVHTLSPPINEAELNMVLPLGPLNPSRPSTPSGGGNGGAAHIHVPSPTPTHTPGQTEWPTFSWEKTPDGFDDDAPPLLRNGTSHLSYAELRKELAFYKGSTVLLVGVCTFMASLLLYMCTHKPDKEEVYAVQHGMDSSHGHGHGHGHGSSHHSIRSPVHGPETGIQFMQISEPQRRGPALPGGVPAPLSVSASSTDAGASAGQLAKDLYKLSGSGGKSGGPLRWQDKIGTLKLSDTSSDDGVAPVGTQQQQQQRKLKNVKSKMTGKSRHKGLGRASSSSRTGSDALPAKVVTHSPLTPSAQGAAASKYQQLQEDDDDDEDWT